MAKTMVTTPYEIRNLDTELSIPAGASLSQYRAVLHSTAQLAVVPGAGVRIIGVAQNPATTDEMVQVATLGISFAEAGTGGYDGDDELAVDNAGKFVVATSGQHVVAKGVVAAAAAHIGSVLLGYRGIVP